MDSSIKINPIALLKNLRLVAAVPLILCLTACSYISQLLKDESTDYRKSNEMPRLQIPGQLNSVSLGQRYPMPATTATSIQEAYSKTDPFSVPRPAVISTGASFSTEHKVKIQKLGDETWVLVSLPPEEVWPRVNYFLQLIKIPAAKVNSQKGLIETELIQFRGDPMKHQFLIVLEQGVQINTTEVRIVQRSFDKQPLVLPVFSNKTSMDIKREKWLQGELANQLAVTINESSASLAGQSIGARSKVSLITAKSSEPFIELKLNPSRAQASIAYSLKRGGFSTLSSDLKKGQFIVTYTDEKGKPSIFWNFLTAWWPGDDKPEQQVEYIVELRRLEETTEIRIMDKNRRGINPKLAIKLLTIIRYNLT